MKASTLQRLDDLFARMPVLVAGPVPDSDIDVAERLVGREFDPDYRCFVGRYGGAMVGSLPIVGHRSAEVMGDESVVNVTSSPDRKFVPRDGAELGKRASSRTRG
ncbi:MAG: hypothetical protein IT379_36685 [Deltaproteobacteria bacterium]|nr:hypothetical protein [Deltaproteobacteria bacterium]